MRSERNSLRIARAQMPQGSNCSKEQSRKLKPMIVRQVRFAKEMMLKMSE